MNMQLPFEFIQTITRLDVQSLEATSQQQPWVIKWQQDWCMKKQAPGEQQQQQQEQPQQQAVMPIHFMGMCSTCCASPMVGLTLAWSTRQSYGVCRAFSQDLLLLTFPCYRLEMPLQNRLLDSKMLHAVPNHHRDDSRSSCHGNVRPATIQATLCQWLTLAKGARTSGTS